MLNGSFRLLHRHPMETNMLPNNIGALKQAKLGYVQRQLTWRLQAA